MSQVLEIQAGAVRLRARAWGERENPVVILVHGYPDTHEMWTQVAEDLARDHYVVAYDVRGAGASSVPTRTRDYRLSAFADDLGFVLDAVSPERPVHLVGHDWGSIHTWEAVTEERFAGRIASFTSISGPCLDHVAAWIRQRLRRPSLVGLRKLAIQLLRSWYVFAFHLPGAGYAWKLGLGFLWPLVLRLTEGVRTAPSRTRGSDGYRGVAMYRANFLGRLLFPRKRVAHAPVQVIAPRDDRYVTPALSEDLSPFVPRLYRREVRGGHWLPLANPELVAGYVRDLAAAVETGSEPGPLRRARVRGELKPYSGRLAVVTGAGSGIGRTTALALAEQGAVVVAADVNGEAAERTAVLARLLGPEAHACTLDVGDTQAMERFATWVEETLGPPDIVINNAGIGLAGGVLQTSAEHWERILRVNLWGVIHGARLFGRQLATRKLGGHIVNVASAAAYAPSLTYPAYATSKAATLMLTECLRAELAPLGIGVSAVCPGFVETGIARATIYAGADESEQTRLRNEAHKLYQRRGLKPERVTRAILVAMRRNRAVVRVGIEAQGAYFLARLWPGLARTFARIDLRPRLASAPAREEVKARPVRFEWSGTPLHWIPGEAFVTHFTNVLHLLLPEGELWFCRVYGKALPFIANPELAQSVRGFIQQEAQHGKAHRAVLEHYYQAFDIPTASYTNRLRWLFSQLLGEAPLGIALSQGWLARRWLIFRLGVIAAIEHFTCVIGKWVLEADELERAGADPMMLHLLRWHGAEEVEHRHVAHDLFVHMGGGYLYRVLLMLLVAPILLGFWLWGVRYLLARDPAAPRTVSVLLAWQRAAERGLLPGIALLVYACLRYLKPNYHPYTEADTTKALAYLEVSPAIRTLSRTQNALS